jgi:hypothetical protein
VAQTVAILLTSVTLALAASAVDRSREQVIKIVTQIRRAIIVNCRGTYGIGNIAKALLPACHRLPE